MPFDERSARDPQRRAAAWSTPRPAEPSRASTSVGWIKRGPSGVIGTNKKDAQETVDAILADLSPPIDGDVTRRERAPVHAPEDPDAGRGRGAAPRAPARTRHLRGWEAIDRHERALGEPAGRPRVKLTRIEEMLRIAASEGR